jgi:phage tail tape-measure protein
MAGGKKHADADSEHRDPITHTPGAHPVGVGAGAGAAGVAGAAIGGAVGGPLGAMVGAAVGAVAGGLGGKAAAEAVNPTVEDEWWRSNYSRRPYAKPGHSYETYQPAYEYGWQARMMHADADWSEIEPNLAAGWPQARGDSTLEWADAQHAAKDAWDRIGPPIGSSKRH